VRIALPGGECAKLARQDADIRIVDVTIEDISSDVAILPLSDCASHNPEGIKIIRTVKIQSILFRNALRVFDFLRDRPKFIRDQ
jgi:hypothetical protein